MNYADTNWLEAVYILPQGQLAMQRRQIVERFARRCGGQLAISHVVLLESRNVFSRTTGEKDPQEWALLEADFGGRLYVDAMNWDLLRRESYSILSRYAWKAQLGTFDVATVASAKLAGATQFLSFDTNAKALAAAEGLRVFPPLDSAGKHRLAELKQR
jgi:predicted nucleic acid-binding protein